ncbi:MAG: helix-turn-helix transcriptional regulator [Mobilicoccus sp.]|nr:helix-turn-helix transcriptional regulator [Mobilicoccus sp.]
MSAGEAFAELRHAADLSVADVAHHAGVDEATIARYEAGGEVSDVTYWRLICGLSSAMHAGGVR